MRCTKIITKLERYIEGSLSVSEINDIEEHLSGCNSCSFELGNIRLFQKQFSSDSQSEIPLRYSFEITESIHNKLQNSRSSGKISFGTLIREHAIYISFGLLAGISGFLMSHSLWFTQDSKNLVANKEIIIKMKPFDGNSDGSLFQLYTDYVVSYKESDLQ